MLIYGNTYLAAQADAIASRQAGPGAAHRPLPAARGSGAPAMAPERTPGPGETKGERPLIEALPGQG